MVGVIVIVWLSVAHLQFHKVCHSILTRNLLCHTSMTKPRQLSLPYCKTDTVYIPIFCFTSDMGSFHQGSCLFNCEVALLLM